MAQILPEISRYFTLNKYFVKLYVGRIQNYLTTKLLRLRQRILAHGLQYFVVIVCSDYFLSNQFV